MHASEVLSSLEAAGIRLSPAPTPGILYASPREAVTEAHRRLIREHKPALLALLTRGPVPTLTAAERNAIAEAVTERAAIREFDGGEPRPVAEREARAAMRVYRALIAMDGGRPARWVTLIAPGCDLEQARHTVAGQFGAARVLELVEHRGRAA